MQQSKAVNGSHEIPQKSLQIKQDDKFFSRLMSKDISMANSSSRVYYRGASGSVPFIWESQPGTPKHKLFNDNSLPPLTPPPSYQSSSESKTNRKNTKPSLLSNVFPRLSSKKNHVSPSITSWSCTSSSSSSSSRSSSSSLTQNNSKTSISHRRSFPSSTLPIRYGTDDNEGNNPGTTSSTSTFCFNSKRTSFRKSGGCYSIAIMKNALLSIIVGHGSGQGTTA